MKGSEGCTKGPHLHVSDFQRPQSGLLALVMRGSDPKGDRTLVLDGCADYTLMVWLTSCSMRLDGDGLCVSMRLRSLVEDSANWIPWNSMLGSLTFYRRILKDNVFSRPYSQGAAFQPTGGAVTADSRLPTLGHGIAGIMAGATVSFIAAPVEHVKARLQIQYAADKSKRLYSGPIDCCTKILRSHGFQGLYHGLAATLLFRSFFFFWWGSYDVFTRLLSNHTSLSAPAINFWAGGLSAQVFWITSYPSDVVKQRIMTDPLGGSLGDGDRRFPRWKDAAKEILRRDGVRGYWRGFLPCFLRAFPANAMALVAFESVMRALPE